MVLGLGVRLLRRGEFNAVQIQIAGVQNLDREHVAASGQEHRLLVLMEIPMVPVASFVTVIRGTS